MSFFWRTILDLRDYMLAFTSALVENGHLTSFWNDRWLSDVTLRNLFPILYALSLDKYCSIADFLINQDWSTNFRYPLP